MQIAFKQITGEKNLRGKRVLLRLDLNVPVVGEEVRDDFRIRAIFPTLEFLRTAGAKTIIISHIENDVTDSLARVVSYISRFVEVKAFVQDLASAPSIISKMADGDIIALENLRKDPGEKANDSVFAGRLASFADIYVNDAFAASHREHASIVALPKFIPSFAGPLLAEEVARISEAFDPPRPFLFILGGAKFDTKLPLIEKFLGIADYVFVGGALANDIFKEKGYEVGTSVVSKSPINLRHIESNPKLIIPSDVVVANPLEKTTKSPQSVISEDRIYDAGENTVSQLSDLLNEVRFVVWNGPLGDYEKGYTEGTERLVRALIESRAKTIIGGGDTVACVAKLGLLGKFSFVSTGGGAMIEFLATGTLPGIDALKQ
ncbi:MAG: phosphoglycerate kinase [Candidatus Paceibacterota bacterium]|jgi:phosphoglycerate kinase